MNLGDRHKGVKVKGFLQIKIVLHVSAREKIC